MSEADQEIVNEASYEELLTGKKTEKKTRKPDPTKDPRWHAVRGLTYSMNIMSGRIERAYKDGFQEYHIATFYTLTIRQLAEKKNRLIAEIHKVGP